ILPKSKTDENIFVCQVGDEPAIPSDVCRSISRYMSSVFIFAVRSAAGTSWIPPADSGRSLTASCETLAPQCDDVNGFSTPIGISGLHRYDGPRTNLANGIPSEIPHYRRVES